MDGGGIDMVDAITDGEFQSKVLEAELPVLVDFWAPWCGPCRMVAPIVEEIATERGSSLRVYKMNVDENPATASRYQIMNIPMLGVYRGGALVGRIVGYKPRTALEREVNQFIAASATA